MERNLVYDGILSLIKVNLIKGKITMFVAICHLIAFTILLYYIRTLHREIVGLQIKIASLESSLSSVSRKLNQTSY